MCMECDLNLTRGRIRFAVDDVRHKKYVCVCVCMLFELHFN